MCIVQCACISIGARTHAHTHSLTHSLTESVGSGAGMLLEPSQGGLKVFPGLVAEPARANNTQWYTAGRSDFTLGTERDLNNHY